jgi:predicted Rossmann-fold nucleotide-binding protein
MSRVIVAGGRTFIPNNNHYIWLSKKFNEIKPTEILCGCCRGADTFGEQLALSMGIPIRYFKPDWNKYKKTAGYRRNKEMAENADICILFPGGKGTALMHELAKEYGLPVFEYINE